MLAKNLAEQLKKKLKEDGKLGDYGQTLQFKKIYMAQPGNIIVEEFVEKEFVKFLNTTGAVCEIASKEIMSDQGEQLMFAVGNLTQTAVDTFVAAHSCNKYCELLGLPCV
ncbi:transient receptor potential cation channel subfamily M member 6-like [Paramuricea clavata]|uniref:Transient receptor potential cation channel subfamily M member 6-like n=1 Tax=Paramuricea clavata TaxID=317549 RepID=A0A7D9JXP9_PARCT|nr:transient receptor potential cation channel subfamily M member 6-like [Paramuricea clavata]